MKNLAKNLLKAVEKHDTAAFEALGNEDLYIKTVKADTALRENISYILDDFTLRQKRNRSQFGELISSVEKAAGRSNPKIKPVSVKILDRLPGKYLIDDYNVEITFKANGRSMKIFTVVSGTNGCFYLFEPVLADVMVK